MDKLTEKLTQQIDNALYLWESITLKELVDFYPLTGLAELYTYLKIACDSPNHTVTFGEELLIINEELRVTMLPITFRRQSIVPYKQLTFAVALAMVTKPLKVESLPKNPDNRRSAILSSRSGFIRISD